MNIVVLAGGLSMERDVSITSGKLVAKALKEKGHNVILLDPFLGYEKEINNIDSLFKENADFVDDISVATNIPNLEKIKNKRKNKSNSDIGDNVIKFCSYADITFLALHGDIGENGKLQGAFDVMGIKYTGSGSLGSAIAMDKGVSKDLFYANNISTPKGIILSFNNKEDIKNWKTYPCVVKPCSGGSSVGVYIVNNEKELKKAINKAFVFETELIIEEYIKGREFSIGILGNNVLPIIEIIPETGFYDYVNKYQEGKTKEVCPAKLNKNVEEELFSQAKKVFKVLKLNVYGRVDFLVDNKDKVYCLEANTLPGMTPLSLLPIEARAANIEFGDLCNKIIDISMEKYI